MDAILDLTSRAVSSIILIQDSLVRIKKDSMVFAAPESANESLFQEFIKSEKQIKGLECRL